MSTTESEDIFVAIAVELQCAMSVTNAEVYKGKPYGMAQNDYDEIVAFLNSPQQTPCYPARMAGGSSR